MPAVFSDQFAFVSILSAILLGAISPGPSFVLVSRVAISGSRSTGLFAALGMGAGGAIFSALALLGLNALLLQSIWLFVALKFLGGAYLIHLGLRIWRQASQPLSSIGAAEASMPNGRIFLSALLTQLSNPKTAVVYASIFAALLPKSPVPWLLVSLPPSIFVVEAGWYLAVALVFSSAGPRAVYARAKAWIDRAAGVVMAGLGARLMLDGAGLR
ncbi:MAG: LysE family translocator [Allorhizobium sp.]